MSDSASLFSTTTTLVDEPILNTVRESGGLIPASDCFVELLIHHNQFKADVDQLTRAGLPSTYDRVSRPSTSRIGLGKLNMKKRLQVQFPRIVLAHAKVEEREEATLDDVRRRRQEGKSTVGKRMTLFDTLEDDLVGVQSKRVLDVIIAMLFQGRDLQTPTLYYPAQSVLSTPRWAASKDGGYATAPAQWATLSFMSPSLGGAEESKSDAEQRFLKSVGKSETDEEIMERLFVPDAASRELMQTLLTHLESRGAIWTRAGRVTKPSIKNAKPQHRPEYVVLGLFPEPFASRCKAHYRSGRDWTADVREEAKSKQAPLITVSPRDEDGGKTSKKAGREGGQVDFLDGWSIRTAAFEPFRTGSPWEDSSAAMFAAGAAAGSAGC